MLRHKLTHFLRQMTLVSLPPQVRQPPPWHHRW